MKLFGRFAVLLSAAVLAGSPIRTNSRYDVTVDVGTVLDEAGNGKVIAAYGYDLNSDYSYISYRLTDARPGDIVLTICYIEPGSVDNIIVRNDYIVHAAH